MEEFEPKTEKKSKKGIVIAVVATAILTFGITNFLNNYVFIYLPSDSPNEAFSDKLKAVNRILDKNYLYDIDDNAAAEAAVAAYVEGLGEPYTHYYSAEIFQKYLTEIQDAYVGIGISVLANANNEIEIRDVNAGSPAEAAGVKAGDILCAVEGEKFDGMHMDGAVEKIKTGEDGTNVNITVKRDGAEFDLTVVRGKIDKESVSGKMLENNVGYISVSGFNSASQDDKRSTFTEFEETFTSLKNEGMQKMIIDLRHNPGGDLHVMCDMADFIVPKGTITSIEYKSGKKETYSSDENEVDMPIVILINKGSASAAELFTICLKDYGKATVIGETSYGKGIVQSVYPFLDGSGMSVTVAKYYSPNGTCIHGTGVTPDITVELPDEYKNYSAELIPDGEDTQLLKAIEVINQ